MRDPLGISHLSDHFLTAYVNQFDGIENIAYSNIIANIQNYIQYKKR